MALFSVAGANHHQSLPPLRSSHAPLHSRLPWRHAHDSESVHASRGAVRVRSGRPSIPDHRPSHAGRYGPDLWDPRASSPNVGPPSHGMGTCDRCNIRAICPKVRLWRHDGTGVYRDRRGLGGRRAVSAVAPESGAPAVKTPTAPRPSPRSRSGSATSS